MKELLFDGRSQFGRFVFQQLLNGMESSLRYRFSNPQKLVKASGIQTGQTVLEVGCGSGFFTPSLSEIVGEDGIIESIDYHPMAVESTSKKTRLLGKQNVRVSRADAHNTDFPDASFDTVILYGIVPAPVISEKQLGLEIYRLLKPGGILAIWTIAPFWSPKTLMKAAPFNLVNKLHGVYRLHKKA